MLGGVRRQRMARETLLALLDLHDTRRREIAIAQVLTDGAEQLYGDGLTAVLRPDARYYRRGRLWKVPFSYEEKLAAMDSLLKLVPDRALGGFVIALGNDDPELQKAAIWLISDIPGDEAERALLTVLQDHRAAIRHPTMKALARRWNEDNVSRLIHPHGSVVSQGASWLGQYGDVRSQHTLIAALKDREIGSVDNEEAAATIVAAIAQIARRADSDYVERAVRICEVVMQSNLWGAAAYDIASQTVDEMA